MFIVDECTDKVFIEFLRSKSEVGVKFKSFQRRAERHFQQKLGKYMVPHTLSCVRSDNVMENICAEVREGFDADGIRHEFSSVYCQWQDGKSEHFIRIYWEGGEVLPVHHVESPSLVHLDDPDPVLTGTSEVSVLLTRVQTARVAVVTVFGGPFQRVSPLGYPILSHSVSKGMVLGRLALSLERPVSRSAFARYSHRFQVFAPSISRLPLLAMSAFSRVPRHLGDVYRDVSCEGWKSAIRTELDNFRDM
jgi:hypothetical protein